MSDILDLALLDTMSASEAGAVMILRHPLTKAPIADGDKVATFTLRGMQSETAVRKQAEMQQRRLDQLGDGQEIKITSADLQAQSIELLASLVITFANIDWQGVPMECTPSNIRMLLTSRPWIRQQVDKFVGDLSHFMGNSVGSSSPSPVIAGGLGGDLPETR